MNIDFFIHPLPRALLKLSTFCSSSLSVVTSVMQTKSAAPLLEEGGPLISRNLLSLQRSLKNGLSLNRCATACSTQGWPTGGLEVGLQYEWEQCRYVVK